MSTIKINRDVRAADSLKEWEGNPRSISKAGFSRLKRQIQKLGQYKPILITDDGTVLGGNMRLKAYQELGIKDIWVSVVSADTEEKKIEYALSDNDRAGKYDGDQLANLTGSFPEVEWCDYAVDIKEPLSVKDMGDQFNIDFEDISGNEDREKKFKDTTVTCPHCEKSFNIKV